MPHVDMASLENVAAVLFELIEAQHLWVQGVDWAKI